MESNKPQEGKGCSRAGKCRKTKPKRKQHESSTPRGRLKPAKKTLHETRLQEESKANSRNNLAIKKAKQLNASQLEKANKARISKMNRAIVEAKIKCRPHCGPSSGAAPPKRSLNLN